MKYVHRRSLCYLATLNEQEGRNVQRKIVDGDVIGLDNVIVATSEDVDNLIPSLREHKFIEAPRVDVVQSDLIVTESKIVRR